MRNKPTREEYEAFWAIFDAQQRKARERFNTIPPENFTTETEQEAPDA